MPVSFRLAVAAALIIALGWAAPQTAARAPAPAAKKFLTWAHEGSDLKPDARVRYGQLPNGMRYALMRTNRPENHASIRLRIDAGSLHETEAELGLAHYLEHMAFQGSKNLTRNELVATLQRLGAAFGADTNAYTSFDETVYQLNLPKADPATLNQGIALIREVADRLTITPEAVTAERGVILSEERVRDTPGLRSARKLYALAYAGMLAPERFPIGKTEVLKRLDAAAIRAFYERYYRPERALLVVTGAFELDAVETELKAKFSDWQQPGSEGPEPAYGMPRLGGPLRADNAVDPSFTDSVALSWMAVEPHVPASRAEEMVSVKQALAFQIVNTRLARLAQSANPPFASASVGCTFEDIQSGDYARRCSLNVSAGKNPWGTSLAAAEQVLRQAVAYPPDAGEVARAKRVWRAGWETAARTAENPDTAGSADGIVSSFSGRGVFMHPKDYLDTFNAGVEAATAADLHAVLRDLFGTKPHHVFAQTPVPVTGGPKAMVRTVNAAMARPVTAPAIIAEKNFPYTDFGTAGTIAARTELKDLGVTQVTFANGVRLNLLPIFDEKNIVRTAVRLPGGMVTFPKGQPVFESGYTAGLLTGGLGKLTVDEYRDAAAGKTSSFNFDISTADYQFRGVAARQDLLFHLQSITAYLTDAAYRPEGLARAKVNLDTSYKARSATAGNALAWMLGKVLANEEPRWGTATPDDARGLTIEAIKTRLQPALANSAVEVTVTGDIPIEEAVDAVAKTLGALPARPALTPTTIATGELVFPTERRALTLTHDGRADQALIFVAWPARGIFPDVRESRATALAQEVLQVALTESLRDRGLTYGVNVNHAPSSDVSTYGYVSVQVEAKPQDLDTILTLITGQASTIAKGEVPDDLLKRAREPAIAAREAQSKTSAYWSGALSDTQARPEMIAAIRTRIEDFKTVTRDEVIKAAGQVFSGPPRVEIRVLPAKPAG
ncbi:MAG TPA: hypothetical protein DCL54_16220 [Alphaproteobacteria bacterium]|nr:hypothetical protein [Alphaproteobacteria bacterium]HAJ48119.1 hypothetical protein [Alphaproteobacteria bacterium]